MFVLNSNKIVDHRPLFGFLSLRSFSVISKDTFVVPCPVKTRCVGLHSKEDVHKLCHAYLIQFSSAFRPIVNTGTLKTSAYSWFLGYFFLTFSLTTDTIMWLVRTQKVLKVPPFYAQLLNLCLESRYSTKTAGLFKGSIPIGSGDSLYDIFYNLTLSEIREICRGTFLQGWANDFCNIKQLHSVLETVRTNSHSIEGTDTNYSGVDYTALFERIDSLFLEIRVSDIGLKSIKFDSHETESLSIYRFRNSGEEGKFIAQSKGLEAISDPTFSIQVIFLRMFGAQFSHSSDAGEFSSLSSVSLPGEMSILVNSIPVNEIFESLFSIRSEEDRYSSDIESSSEAPSDTSTFRGKSKTNSKFNNSKTFKSTYTTLAVGRVNKSNTVPSHSNVLKFYFDTPIVFTISKCGGFVNSS